MSLYPQQVQQQSINSSNGGLPHNQFAGSSSADLSLLDQNVGSMNGYDMDLTLPMDFDVDLETAPPGPGIDPRTYHAVGPPVANSISRQPQDLNMGGASTGSVNASYGPPDALPSQQQEQQQQIQEVQERIREQMQLQQDQQDAARGGAGAGPLPAGFGLTTASTTSTLTEFTKRRNWSQRIIEELKDLLHILTPDGRILYVSPSCRTITGHEPNDLIGKFMGEFVHPDDSGIFMREFNESIASGNPLRFFYRFKKEDGDFMIFECDGHPHISAGDGSNQPLSYGQSPIQQIPISLPGVCRGFFMMARPYPTKNAALLDSFLEHKIENERLLKRIEELKREEANDTAEQERIYLEHVSGTGAATPSSVTAAHAQDKASESATPNYQGMPPPAKPSISNIALTRQNLDSALSAQRPDSMADKMSRYEANSNHLESIEMLTGLNYRDGERSHGISTGDTSPALIRGDAGIAILLDRDRDASKKEKKKLKIVDEYVCADCGTLDSPEWRKGPKGPKTLCNACGLRWAKKEKKRGGGDDSKDLTPTSATGYGQAGVGGGFNMPPPPIGLLQHHSSGSVSQ